VSVDVPDARPGQDDRRRRARTAVLVCGGASVIGLAIMGATYLAAARSHHPTGTYTRDVSTLAAEGGAHLPHFAGAVSLLNIMVFAATGWSCVLAAWLLPAARWWMCGLASLTFLLAADDALLLHETIGPSHHVPERAFYGLYAVAGLVLLLGRIRSGQRLVLAPFLLGALFLGASVVADQLWADEVLFEDGFKLMGSLLWLGVPVVVLSYVRFGVALKPHVRGGISGNDD
jgi:hypothetical protein